MLAACVTVVLSIKIFKADVPIPTSGGSGARSRRTTVSSSFPEKSPHRKQAEVLNASPPGFASGLLKRMAFDAGSEVGRCFLVVCIGSSLAGRCSLFKRKAMLLDEGHEFVRGRSVDVIDVLGRLIVDFRALSVHSTFTLVRPFLVIESEIDTMRQSAGFFTSAT